MTSERGAKPGGCQHRERRARRRFGSRLAFGALAALLALATFPTARAAELEGLVAPERVSLAGRELRLNGIGVRAATRFMITAKIYAAALYLEAPATAAREVLDSSGLKVIRLRYLYDIPENDMKRAWGYSFEQNCAPRCAAALPEIEQFQQLVDGVSDGDTYEYRFLGDRIEVIRNGTPRGTVAGAEFAKLLLATWIGVAPPTEELKASLLRGSARE